MSELTVVDKFALYAGGALVVFGIVGIGLLEMVAGAPHPVTGEGQIVHEALVPIAIRSYLILLGFLLWGGLAVWRFVTSSVISGYGVPAPTETE